MLGGELGADLKQVVGGFTNDLNVTDYCVLQHLIGYELLFGHARSVSKNPIRSLQHVEEIVLSAEFVLVQSDAASARTFSRKWG